MEGYGGSGVLSENEPVNKEQASAASYEPTEEERKAIKLARSIFTKNKKYRERYDKNWTRFYKFYRGKQWNEDRPAWRHSEVFNFTMQTIRAQVPIITDARPKWEFVPENPMDRDFAEILNQVSEADWQKNNWSNVLVEWLYDSHIYGTGMTEMGHEGDLKKSLTGVTFKSKDLFYCFPAPQAFDVNDNCPNFVYAEPVDIEQLKSEHPQKAAYLKADLVDLVGEDKTDLGPARYVSATSDARFSAEPGSGSEYYRNQALVVSCWTKSDEYIDVECGETTDANGITKKIYEQRLKYPNGRFIKYQGNVLLEDKSMPYDDGKIPFIKLINSMLPREYYGVSEVEALEGPNKIFNKVMSFALDVLTLMGNPIWVIPTNSEIDTDNLFNQPGMIVEPNPEAAPHVRREEGVQLQPYVLQIAEMVHGYITSLGGMNDAVQGVKPEGVTAASAIAKLQEAVYTRLREKSRFLDTSLSQAGQMYCSRVLQFTPAPRIIRITDNQGATKYFKFSVEDMKHPDGSPMFNKAGEPQRMARVRNFIQNTKTGQISEAAENTYQIYGKFDVRVNTGSGLGFEKDRKLQTAQMLFDRGAIDELELLKASDWPEPEVTYQKVMERKAAMAPPPEGAPPAA